VAAVLNISCDRAVSRMASKMGKDERPTMGHIKIAVDEAYYPLSEAQLLHF
jgi:hypothetical protein